MSRAAFALALVVTAVACSSASPGSRLTGSNAPGSTPILGSPGPSPSSSAPSPSTSGGPTVTGAGIMLRGDEPGLRMLVTVVRVYDPARQKGFFRVSKGHRLVAVKVRLANTGTASYTDSPSNGAVVVDDHSHRYDASLLVETSSCAEFPNVATVAPAASRLGCITFEVPKHAHLVRFEFTLESGFGPDTGAWTLS